MWCTWVSSEWNRFFFLPLVLHYSILHFFLFFLTGGGHSTALMASSNTVLRPRCVRAEHSRYFTAPGSGRNLLTLCNWKQITNKIVLCSKLTCKVEQHESILLYTHVTMTIKTILFLRTIIIKQLWRDEARKYYITFINANKLLENSRFILIVPQAIRTLNSAPPTPNTHHIQIHVATSNTFLVSVLPLHCRITYYHYQKKRKSSIQR